jgi:hypothetical protein
VSAPVYDAAGRRFSFLWQLHDQLGKDRAYMRRLHALGVGLRKAKSRPGQRIDYFGCSTFAAAADRVAAVIQDRISKHLDGAE